MMTLYRVLLVLLTLELTSGKWDCLDLGTKEYYGDFNTITRTADRVTKQRPCLFWRDVPPHEFPDEYDDEHLEENFCRVLSKMNRGAECFFLNDNNVTELEFCRVPPCKAHSGCVRGSGQDYRDNGRYTDSGHLCLPWRNDYNLSVDPDAYPDSALEENYCRNPDNSSSPWCYYEAGGAILRDNCRIPPCSTTALEKFRRKEETYIPAYNSKYIPGPNVSVEDCAVACLEENTFVCRGFEYREVWPFTNRLCILTSENVYTLGEHETKWGPSIDLFTRLDKICDAFAGTTLPQNCPLPLSINSRVQMVMDASSSYSPSNAPEHASLQESTWWRPSDSDVDPWIQICFEERTVITGLFIRGSGTDEYGWVDKFSIAYSLDSVNWWFIRDYHNITKNKAEIQEFTGNAEPRCVKSVVFESPIRALCLRLYPETFTKMIGLRMELFGCLDNDCDKSVGLSTNAIPNTSFSTSSTDGIDSHSPHMARIKLLYEPSGGWVPHPSSNDAWLQVHMLRDHRIHAVVSQGCEASWVTQYTVSYFRGGTLFTYTDENEEVVFLDGNKDEISLKMNYLEEPFAASAVRVTPISWYSKICLRLEFVGCVNRVCSERLGMESGVIEDHQLTASTSFSKRPVTNGRLHYETWEENDVERACWSSTGVNGPDEYMQIDLGRPHTITGVISQGSGDDGYLNWVEEYRLEFLSLTEEGYHTYLDLDGSDMIFSANSDQNTEVHNVLDRPIVTSVVRVKPYTWHNILFCMRVEILGCPYEDVGDVCDLDGTFQFEGYCYGAVNNQFPNACHEIFSETSSLVSIKSDATYQYLRDIANRFQIDHQQYYKVGLRSVSCNRSSEGNASIVFLWEDGTPQTLDLFGHPTMGLQSDREYCVQMLLYNNLMWEAYDCSSMSALRASLCQSDINECIGPHNMCSHECHNTRGSYYCHCPPGMILHPSNRTQCIDFCGINTSVGSSYVVTDAVSSTCSVLYSTEQDYWAANKTCAAFGTRLLSTYYGVHNPNTTLNGTLTSWIMTDSAPSSNVCDYFDVSEDGDVVYRSAGCDQMKPFGCTSEFEQLSCQDTWATGEVGTTSAAAGSIVARAYAPYYMAGTSCRIDIRGPIGLVVRIIFHQITLRRELANSDCYDELILTDIHSSGTESVRGVYTGSISENTIISRSSHVTLDLRIGCISANMPDILGYDATYSLIDCNTEKCETGCDHHEDFTSVSGRLSSMGFPMRVPAFTRCSWRILAPAGMFISLTFDRFDIRATGDGDCMDSLTVQERNRTLVLCGHRPPLYVSTSNELTLTYETGLDVMSRGFIASYQQTDRGSCGIGYQSCSGDYVCGWNKGVLASPNYPFNVPPACHSSWHIVTDLRTFIVIEFVVFNIPEAACSENYVEIFGLSSYDVARFCNTSSTKVTGLRSLKNSLRITFTSSIKPSPGMAFYANYAAKRFSADSLNHMSDFNITDQCPESWELWNGHCYQFVEEVENLPWVEAEESCENRNATLVSISTRREVEFIQYMLTNVWTTEIDQVYIGLTDRATDGSFHWIDGRPLSYTDWFYDRDNILHRQPNDGLLGGCSIIQLHDYGSTSNWHDVPCALPRTNQYVCKRPAGVFEDVELLEGYIGSKIPDPSLSLSGMSQNRRVHHDGSRVATRYTSSATNEEGRIQNSDLFRKLVDYSCGDGEGCPSGWFLAGNHCVSLSRGLPSADRTTDGVFVTQADLEVLAGLLQHVWRADVTERFVYGGTEGGDSDTCVGLSYDRRWFWETFNCTMELDGVISITESTDSTEHCHEPLVACGSGECIHEVYVCDRRPDCADGSDENDCPRNGEFCGEGMMACGDGYCISSSFICDFVHDCPDASDEYQCEFPECSMTEFECENGQCISGSKECDLHADCVDGSDELFCEFCRDGFQCFDGSCIPPRAVCDGVLDCPGTFHEDETDLCAPSCGKDQLECSHGVCTDISNACIYGYDGYRLQRGCRDLSHLTDCDFFECPAFTFKCPGSYCIDLQLRCDGAWDCPDGEDEFHCEEFNCPGAYRCHESSSCVALHQRCNGINECPNRDDELFCDTTCPTGCQCTGLVFSCKNTEWDVEKAAILPRSMRILSLSTVNQYRQIRSITEENSILRALHLNLSHFRFLVKLDLSSNGLTHLAPDTFIHQSNLRDLSLADNEITHLERNTFSGLERLLSLNLSGIPLMTISPGAFRSLMSLPRLNLGRLKISRIESNSFEGLESLHTLDLSYNSIQVVEEYGLRGLNNTITLNLTGNTIERYNEDFLSDLINLKELYSDIFLFCCMRTDLDVCRPEPGPFSSCGDLIRSPWLRVAMWILGLSAFIGNVTVIVWRIKTKEKNRIQSLLIFNLAVSDCLMGVYMLIIASADLHFRDVYVFKASHWLSSFTCSLAGSLSVVSSEVSVYILTVISLDRFICVVFPFGRFKLTRKKALVASSIGWTCGIILALLPAMKLRYFGDAYYGRSGVCLAIPLDSSRTPGWIFSVTFFLGLNFVCLVIMAACYVTIIVVAKRSARSIRSNKTLSNDLKLASRTAMIVCTDLFCWLPIIVMGTLATAGYIEVPPIIYAWTAIFILPINSSINPYLYTFSTLRKRRTLQRVTLSYENGSGTSTPRSHRRALKMGTPTNVVHLRGGPCHQSLYGLPKGITAADAEEIAAALRVALNEIHSMNLHPNNIHEEIVIKKNSNNWRVFVSFPFSAGQTRECSCKRDVDFIIRRIKSMDVYDTAI